MRPRGSAVSLEKRRLRAMEFLKQGMGVREIARRLRVAAGSVSRWAKEVEREGRGRLEIQACLWAAQEAERPPREKRKRMTGARVLSPWLKLQTSR
jgi:transposase